VEGGAAIGRFTDDTYFGGNPWYLTTAAFAEFHYRLARELERRGSFALTERNIAFFSGLLPAQEVRAGARIRMDGPSGRALSKGLLAKGDRFMATLRLYAGSEGELSEQFDRAAGVPVSAYDLSWSYASFLSAADARLFVTGKRPSMRSASSPGD
jgi:glucoamylase